MTCPVITDTFALENKRYAEAFNYVDDPKEFARQIYKAGYATGPNYAAKI